tara:strand:- start:1079 stop:1597 length:519 start_codon:yes stop_codon:yes gene_type:complete
MANPKSISYSLDDDVVSDDLLEKKAKPTILEQLRTEVAKKVERPEIEIPIPERAGVSVRFSPNITQNQLRAWRRNSGENSKDGFDPLKFACYVVGSCCTSILINDEIALSAEGINLTFASPDILEMTNDNRPIPDGIRHFYGIDPHLESTALAILDAAGYGEEVEEVNPTIR